MPLLDGMIAATALQHDLIVATRNSRDFQKTGVKTSNPYDLLRHLSKPSSRLLTERAYTMTISEESVLWIGHLCAISCSRERCSSESGPVISTVRSMR